MVISALVEKLYDRANNLAARRFWPTVLGLLLLIFLLNGFDFFPEPNFQLLSQNPFITRTDLGETNTVQENILLPIVAHTAGLTSDAGFHALSLAIILTAYILFAFLARRAFGDLPALIFSALLFTHPLTTILLAWVGNSDSLSFLLTVPLLFSSSTVLIAALCFLAVTNHPMMLLVMPELLLVRFVARDDKIRAPQLVLGSVGAAAGYAAVRAFLYLNNIHINLTRFEFMQRIKPGAWFYYDTLNLPLIWFSLENIHWLALSVCFLMFFRRDRGYFRLLAALLFANYLLTLVMLDVTRVYSLMSWGLTLHCLFHCYRLSLSGEDPSETREYLKALLPIAALSFLAPRYWVWNGKIFPAPFRALYARIAYYAGLLGQ